MPDRVRPRQSNVGASVRQRQFKDYYSIQMLTSTFEIANKRLHRNIAAKFSRRSTVITMVATPGLSDAFASDPGQMGKARAPSLRTKYFNAGVLTKQAAVKAEGTLSVGFAGAIGRRNAIELTIDPKRCAQ